MIAGNHKPSLRAVDEALRRRIHLVPFTVTIPPEERDLHLRDKLKPEWPGILQWMLDGAVEWHRIGLAPPQIVTGASEAYFAEEDRLSQWIEECCVEDPQAMTRSSVLFASWKRWNEDANERYGGKKTFEQNLSKRFDRGRDSTNRAVFLGLRVADQPVC
jgi:putative DNA primase/helicase